MLGAFNIEGITACLDEIRITITAIGITFLFQKATDITFRESIFGLTVQRY